MITLAALALMIGIYAFQNEQKTAEVQTEESSVETKTLNKRSVASIPAHENFQTGHVSGDVGMNSIPAEHDTINCLNYDGEDICQSNDYSAQENFTEESYVQAEQDSQAIIEEPQMDMEESTTVDYERENTDNALFASTPSQD